jgi:hypothetical protein
MSIWVPIPLHHLAASFWQRFCLPPSCCLKRKEKHRESTWKEKIKLVAKDNGSSIAHSHFPLSRLFTKRLAQEMTKSLSQTVVYQPNDESSNQIDQEWRKAMEQLQQEEEAERKAGTYDYGFQEIQTEGDNPLNV